MPHASGDKTESVFLNDIPGFDSELSEKTDALCANWEMMLTYRDDVMKALEMARANKMIGKALDAKVTVYTTDKAVYDSISAFGSQLSTVYTTSGASVVLGDAPEGAFTETQTGIGVLVENADGCKCDRCWSYSTEGVSDDEGGFLCERCRKILM